MISSTIKLLSATVGVVVLIAAPALAATVHKAKASHHYAASGPDAYGLKPSDRMKSTVGMGEISVPIPIQIFVSS